MSNVLRLAIVDPSDTSRNALKNMLLGMDIVWLEAECSRYEFFADVVGQTKPDIGVVSIDANPEKGLKLIEQMREIAPDCSVLVVSSSTDGQITTPYLKSSYPSGPIIVGCNPEEGLRLDETLCAVLTFPPFVEGETPVPMVPR